MRIFDNSVVILKKILWTRIVPKKVYKDVYKRREMDLTVRGYGKVTY